MRLVRTANGWVVEADGRWFQVPSADSRLTTREDLSGYLAGCVRDGRAVPAPADGDVLPPIEHQEVWAAGVTYFRSRTARMEEANEASGAHFYDLVYNADRPELFFKSAAWRVRGPGQPVRIRGDARWNVPEPELTLLIAPSGRILGYTAGNDMSSRDIEGENPLYLPQAKVYDGSCAIGPAIVVGDAPAAETRIQLEISRKGRVEFAGATTVAQMKRELATLVEYLYRETTFPDGCLLLTGTGIVPPDDFTLAGGDDVAITIDGVGTLRNRVE